MKAEDKANPIELFVTRLPVPPSHHNGTQRCDDGRKQDADFCPSLLLQPREAEAKSGSKSIGGL